MACYSGRFQSRQMRLEIRRLSLQITRPAILEKRIPVQSRMSAAHEDPRARYLLQTSVEGFLEIETTAAGETCSSLCPCKCHTQGLINTPLWLQGALGALFFNYAGIPVFSATHCNYPECRKRETPAIQFTYFFPTWAVSRAILLTLSADDLTGTGASICIRMPRLTAHDALGWQLVRNGNLSAVQRMFSTGVASPFDVDTHGRSLLHVCSAASLKYNLITQGLLNYSNRKPFTVFKWTFVATSYRREQDLTTKTRMAGMWRLGLKMTNKLMEAALTVF